ncbi:MAG TPA: tail fiber protein [Pyrinomonadaceae bacterium]|jgi:microcystin-dependent protein|nr:tail fiber protein [Pyrinomonadaceae bacterium]
MASPFVAEIRIVGFNFAPTGWALCNGQLLPISQNTALFSLLGTYYGGNGQSTFALPDLQGSVPIGMGDGSGLSQRFLGERSGSETVTLFQTEMPAHNHALMANSTTGTKSLATGNSFARASGATPYAVGNPIPATAQMAFQEMSVAGGDFPHNNMQPYLTLNFVIAMQGVFPPRQ